MSGGDAGRRFTAVDQMAARPLLVVIGAPPFQAGLIEVAIAEQPPATGGLSALVTPEVGRNLLALLARAIVSAEAANALAEEAIAKAIAERREGGAE